eukprot:365970-Chlamydomonas_euryale.AAC.2
MSWVVGHCWGGGLTFAGWHIGTSLSMLHMCRVAGQAPCLLTCAFIFRIKLGVVLRLRRLWGSWCGCGASRQSMTGGPLSHLMRPCGWPSAVCWRFMPYMVAAHTFACLTSLEHNEALNATAPDQRPCRSPACDDLFACYVLLAVQHLAAGLSLGLADQSLWGQLI